MLKRCAMQLQHTSTPRTAGFASRDGNGEKENQLGTFQDSGNSEPVSAIMSAVHPTKLEEKEPVDTERIIAHYLNKKGFVQAEQALRREAQLAETQAASLLTVGDINIAHYITFYSSNDKFPTQYDLSYTKLAEWVDQSLDMYRV